MNGDLNHDSGYELICAVALALATKAEQMKQASGGDRLAGCLSDLGRKANQLFELAKTCFEQLLIADGMVPEAVEAGCPAREEALSKLLSVVAVIEDASKLLVEQRCPLGFKAADVEQVKLALLTMRSGKVLWGPPDNAGALVEIEDGHTIRLEEFRASLA